MTTEQQQQINGFLRKKAAEIIQAYQERRASYGQQLGDGFLGDWYDQATRDRGVRTQELIEEFEILRLHRLEAAIRRLEDGRFGLCQCCGELISVRRLMANPETPLCYECAAEDEEERRQTTAAH